MSCISVEASNKLNKEIFNIGIWSTATSLAAAAIESPIQWTGGFAFGVVHYVASICTEALTNKLLNANHLNASAETKMLATAIRVVGSALVAWGALASFGISVTAIHLFRICFLGSLIAIPVVLVLACLNMHNMRGEFQEARAAWDRQF